MDNHYVHISSINYGMGENTISVDNWYNCPKRNNATHYFFDKQMNNKPKYANLFFCI